MMETLNTLSLHRLWHGTVAIIDSIAASRGVVNDMIWLKNGEDQILLAVEALGSWWPEYTEQQIILLNCNYSVDVTNDDCNGNLKSCGHTSGADSCQWEDPGQRNEYSMAKINPATYSDTRALIWLPHALLQRVGNWTCWTIIWN